MEKSFVILIGLVIVSVAGIVFVAGQGSYSSSTFSDIPPPFSSIESTVLPPPSSQIFGEITYPASFQLDIEPGVFIVKFKETPTINGVFTNMPEINILNYKYNVVSIERLFKGFDSTKEKIEQKRIEFPIRAGRAAKSFRDPGLHLIYKFYTSKDSNIYKIASAFSKSPNVEYAEPVFIPQSDLEVNDPHFIRNNPRELWGVFKIQADLAWDSFDANNNGIIDADEKKPGEDVIVAIVDSGIDVNHEDLKDNLWDKQFNAEFSSFHGTHIAGTVAAVGNNEKGVIGVAWGSQLIPIIREPESIVEAADSGADIMVTSWYGGLGTVSKLLIDEVDYAAALGVIVIASAGNRNVNVYTQAPAQAENAIAVASSDFFDIKAISSNWGAKIDVTAPGDYILSTVENDGYSWQRGTSFSAPHVAGVAALLLSKNPDLTIEQVRQIIRTSADDLVDPLGDGSDYTGWDSLSGYGRLNARKSLESDLLCGANIKLPSVNYAANMYLWNNPVEFEKRKINFYDAKVLVDNTFEVRGIADSPSFSYYLLEIGEGANPKNWQLIKRGRQSVSNDVLDTIDLTEKSNNEKTVRLRVFTEDGSFCEDRVIVQPTFALITSPVRRNLYFPTSTDVLNFIVPPWNVGDDELIILYPGVRGFVNHPNLKEWSLWYQVIGSRERVLIKKSNNKFELEGSFDSKLRDNILLEKWNHNIPDGELKIILSVTTIDGKEYEDEVIVDYDGTHFPYQQGEWPQIISKWGYATSSPVIYDVDNDGKKEIIVGRSNSLYLYKNDGTLYNENWPIECEFSLPPLQEGEIPEFCVGDIRSSPTVGDIDGDGLAEIGIKSRTFFGREYINIFNLNGELIKFLDYDFFGSVGFIEDTTRSSIVFSDLNNDGVFEIIYGILGEDNVEMERIFVKDHNNAKNDWTAMTDDRIVKNIVVGDINNDGKKEIIVISEKSVYVLSNDGEVLHQWPYENNDFINPILADLNNDGFIEIVVGENNPNARQIHIWNYDGTNFLDKGLINIGGIKTELGEVIDIYQSLVGNIDEDPELEIIVTSLLNRLIDTGRGHLDSEFITGIYAFNHDGTLVDEWPKYYPIDDIGNTYFPGILLDVDNDDKANLIVGSWGNREKGINGFDSKGNLIDDLRFPLRVNHIYYSSPAAGDVDGDGDVEIVYAENAVNHVYLWDLPFSAKGMDWPMFQHDAQHTGFYIKPERRKFIRGDSNSDSMVDLSDAVYVLRYLFSGGREPECLKAADVNDDGIVNMADAVYLLNHLFAGGAEPPAPYPNLGVDDTADKLSCGG